MLDSARNGGAENQPSFALNGARADHGVLQRYFWSRPLTSSVALPAQDPSVHSLPSSLGTQNVTVYTRHKPSCTKSSEPYWKRCHCMKYLYLYKDGESRQVSAKTRSWEKAEERPQEIRDPWNPVRQLERKLQAKLQQGESKQIALVDAVSTFLKEVERLNREESTARRNHPLDQTTTQTHRVAECRLLRGSFGHRIDCLSRDGPVLAPIWNQTLPDQIKCAPWLGPVLPDDRKHAVLAQCSSVASSRRLGRDRSGPGGIALSR
jgi:hypothetical protein